MKSKPSHFDSELLKKTLTKLYSSLTIILYYNRRNPNQINKPSYIPVRLGHHDNALHQISYLVGTVHVVEPILKQMRREILYLFKIWTSIYNLGLGIWI